MRHILNYAAGVVAGAMAMYYFDPHRGRRRRAMLRDQLIGQQHDAGRYLRKTSRRAADHIEGMAAEAASAAGLGAGPRSDPQLAEHIRSEMGRLVERPGAVDVRVSGGHVTLGGHILAWEQQALVSAIKSMRDVESVTNEMQVQQQPGGTPELQG